MIVHRDVEDLSHPGTAAGAVCRASANIFGAYTYEVAEDAESRVERLVTFDDPSGLTDTQCAGVRTSLCGVSQLKPAATPDPQATSPWSISPPTATCNAGATSGADTLTNAHYDAVGDLTSDAFSGGDTAPDGTRAAYTVTYGWQNGVASTTQITGYGPLLQNVTHDAAGLPSTSLDPNNITTTFVHDGLGRLTQIEPEGENATRIAYPDFTTMEVSRSSSGVDGWSASDTTQIFSRTTYDGLGRVIEQRKGLPGGTLGLQITRYDQRGRVIVSGQESAFFSRARRSSTNCCSSERFRR